MIPASSGKAIKVIPFFELPQNLKDRIEKGIKEIYGLDTRFVMDRFEIPPSSFNRARRQYLASRIIDHMKRMKKGDEVAILGIVDVDIYSHGLNFIFGQADRGERIALISLRRLRQEFYGLKEDRGIFLYRALVEVIHELGHIFGLQHCRSPFCVMYFSNTILDTDRKGYRLCPLCKKELEKRGR
jgi:archaemetzincin